MAYTTIDDPSEYFQTLLYTGNGANNRALVNDGNSDLQPDWIWFKERNSTSTHQLLDSSRGVALALSSPDNGADESYAYLSSFDSDGFTFDQSDGSTNDNNNTFVAWQWKANGGTTASNTDGDITSTVQANTTAGFSIVTYTGNGNASAQTVGHGLGADCRLVLLKSRSLGDESWRVFHESVSQSAGGNLFLNGTSGLDTSDPARIISTNTTTFTLDGYHSTYDAINEGSATYLAYCFAEKQGYSKIGSYKGNGNANGAFVHLGFEPAWIMVKLSSADGNSWQIVDNKRNPLNTGNGKRIFPNNTNAESSSDSEGFDFLSNGFKLRNASGGGNTNAATYIYMAFAEHPFVSSKGVPTTAR